MSVVILDVLFVLRELQQAQPFFDVLSRFATKHGGPSYGAVDESQKHILRVVSRLSGTHLPILAKTLHISESILSVYYKTLVQTRSIPFERRIPRNRAQPVT